MVAAGVVRPDEGRHRAVWDRRSEVDIDSRFIVINLDAVDLHHLELLE